MNLNINNEQLIFDGSHYERLLLEKIRGCSSEILISCYIIDFDEFSEKVFKALLEKAIEGVKVCLVADGLGSWGWLNEHAQQYRHPNFEIRVYHPLTWKLLSISVKNIFWGMNRRNHHKLYIFDQKEAFNGSRNINNNALTWRETSISIEGPSVSTLCSLFSDTWHRSNTRWIKRYNFKIAQQVYKKLKGSEHILSTHKFSLRRKNQKIMLRRLVDSKRMIQITTPYFFPTRKVLRAILTKAREGVSVSVLLPRTSDVVISKWITQYHYEQMLKAGIAIYEYSPAILHAKSTLVDEWALIGTSNMNRRSVYRDLEIDYVVSQPKIVEELNQKFVSDIAQSLQITTVPKLGVFRRIIVWIATKIFSSWF
jgi:cardiolipin synthase